MYVCFLKIFKFIKNSQFLQILFNLFSHTYHPYVNLTFRFLPVNFGNKTRKLFLSQFFCLNRFVIKFLIRSRKIDRPSQEFRKNFTRRLWYNSFCMFTSLFAEVIKRIKQNNVIDRSRKGTIIFSKLEELPVKKNSSSCFFIEYAAHRASTIVTIACKQ